MYQLSNKGKELISKHDKFVELAQLFEIEYEPSEINNDTFQTAATLSAFNEDFEGSEWIEDQSIKEWSIDQGGDLDLYKIILPYLDKI